MIRGVVVEVVVVVEKVVVDSSLGEVGGVTKKIWRKEIIDARKLNSK